MKNIFIIIFSILSLFLVVIVLCIFFSEEFQSFTFFDNVSIDKVADSSL
jgi:hypothetical protein